MKMKTISYRKKAVSKNYRLHPIRKKAHQLSKSIPKINQTSPGNSSQDNLQKKISQVIFKTPSQYQTEN